MISKIWKSAAAGALVLLASITVLPVATAQAAIVAKVDLSQQRMHVFVNGKRRYSWRVSTGKRGWRTPTGYYTPSMLYKNYYSKRWRMRMPYTVVISTAGYAIHGTMATGKLGRPASHGCIRLHPSNAKTFYYLVASHGKWNTSVQVVR